MVINCTQYLSQVAAFLKVQAGKINISEDTLPTRVASKTTTTGCLNIIDQFIKESKTDIGGANALEKAEIRQWIEYGIVYGCQNESQANSAQVLKELNSVLLTRTYLVSHRLTVADIFLYYILQGTMENLPIAEKEKNLNVSRWFDNLQQNPSIRQSNKVIDFSTNYLTFIAPARH